MITESQYKDAVAQRESSQAVINAYHAQETKAFDQKWERFRAGEPVFKDSELCYSATTRCGACGAGLAYPTSCGPHHHWSCSAELKGEAKAHPEFPFTFYSIKSENSARCPGQTTRPS